MVLTVPSEIFAIVPLTISPGANPPRIFVMKTSLADDVPGPWVATWPDAWSLWQLPPLLYPDIPEPEPTPNFTLEPPIDWIVIVLLDTAVTT